MAHRSQCSSTGDNPLDPNYLPPHYREEYRMAIDALVEADLEGYYGFLHEVDVVDFLSQSEIEYIRCMVQAPHQTSQLERRCMAEDVDGSSDTYWPVHSDHDAPNLDLGWPQQCRFVGPTEVTTLVNPSDPEMPSIKEQVRRMIKNAQQVIAVVMDMFTDVDIFADILGAATRGVAVYVLLDELNAQHFVGMVNNCRVNLDEIKFMRVRTVSGSTYSCRTGKTFKGQMMERFILVDCRAVLSGNYSFMWSFEKIHRCLAHLFLGQLVTTFDEEFRILFAHSEPLIVENVLANMPNYGGEPEGYYNTEKTHMFNRQYPTMGMEWAERTGQDHMKVGQKNLHFRSESIHSAAEANPSVQRHMNMHVDQPYRGDHQSIEHGRQIRGPNEMVGFKRHSYGNIPDYEYLPPKNHPTMRGNQYMEGAVPQSGHFAREPHIYQGAGLQSGYDMYGKFRFQSHHIEQFTGSGYPHEGDEAEPPGAYDHVQRYLQSQSAMEEGHGPRNVLSPVQSNIKRHSMSQSYTCQSSPKQPSLPEQKLFFNVNLKPQDMSQKQGLRNWRISSYLSAYDDAGELDLAELEGSTTCGDVPCFTQEAPCRPVRAEIRPGNREFNRIPSPRENPMFVQIQNDSIVPDSSVNHPTDLSQINIKTTPTSTSESSCTTEGDKVEETQNRVPKEANRISEEFLKRKPSRPIQRGSRLRHSLIFSSNLELNTSDEVKDTAGEKDGDEASKPRVSQILDKRRTGSQFQPFQWSNFVKSNTFDNSTLESAQPEDELNKKAENSDLDKVENSPNLQKKGPLQEKDQPQTAVPETKSQRDECQSNLLQKTSSFMNMDDPDCRLRYFKELAAKRKLAAAKVPQSNPVKATQKFALPEKPCTNDTDKNAEPVFKTPKTTLKSKNTTVPAPEIKETSKDTKREESSEDILHRATDAEKIRFKKKLAEESSSTLSFFQKDTDPTLKTVKEARTVSAAKNQTSPIFAQKPSYALSGVSASSEPCSKNSLSTASATSEAQNHVEFVAFNTPSTESGLIQFSGPKETDPSHAVLTESCPPVKLPQTKCKSQLSTTQSEGCLFANDSQTIAQSGREESSQHPTSTESETSQNFPIKTVADAFQQPTAAESNSSHHSTANETTSTQQPTETEEDSQLPVKTGTDFTQDSTVAESEMSKQLPVMGTDPAINEPSQQCTATSSNSSNHPAKRANSSQHPSAAEMDSSQQSAASVVDSSQQHTAKESELYLKPTAMGAEPFKQTTPSATDSSQQPTGTVTDSSHPPTVIETDSSQKPVAMETDTSQQSTASVGDIIQKPAVSGADTPQNHTAIECELSPEPFRQPPVLGAGSSQQPTAEVPDLSQQPTATVPDLSQQPTATVPDSAQQSNATVPDSTQQPTVTITDSTQQPSATVTNSTQQPTVTITDSTQQPNATVPDSTQQPSATVTDSTQQPSATVTNSTQQPTVTITDSTKQPSATVTDSTQQPSATVTNSTQQPNGTVPDSTKQPNATVPDSTQQPNATVTDSTQQPSATVTNSTQQPTVTITDSTATVTNSTQQQARTETNSTQQSTATETETSQQPTATEIGASQQLTRTETDSFQQPNATVTDLSQQPTATVPESTQQPTATETVTSQHSTTTEAGTSQQPTRIETDSSQQPTRSEAGTSQQPTRTETDSSQQPTRKEAGTSQQPTRTETDSSQLPTRTETDSTQQPTRTEAGTSQQPTVTDTNFTQQPSVTATNSTQQATRTETDSSQQPTRTEAGTSQQPTVTATNSTQQPTVTEAGTSQQPTATETDSSLQPTVTATNSTQQPTPTVPDSTQQPTVTETDSTQQPSVTATNSTQQPTLTVPDSTQQPTVTVTDSTQQPTVTVPDSTQQPTVTVPDSTQQPTPTVPDSTQQPTVTETDFTQQPSVTVTDSSQQPTVTITNSTQQPTETETDSSQKPAAETYSSQKTTSTAKDSLHQPIAKGTDSSQQLTVTQSVSSQNSTEMTLDTSKHLIETENESIQHITATESDCVNEKNKKDDNLSKGFSKPIPADITQADNSVSQITVITDLSSTAEHSQSGTVSPCDSQTQARTKPCTTHMVKNTDNDALTSLNSVEVSSNQPQGSPKLCLPANEINSTQGITQLQSSISLNPTESCLNDPKPEETDDCQKNETLSEQSQRHNTKITQTEVSTALGPKQTTPEVSEKSDMTVHGSSVENNPKSIMSAQQLSTANVISCSNLRDDTKVLLEQISAKNQSRSSQSKQTPAAPSDAKECVVSSADKLLSNRSGRSWSSKATPEERDMIIQKMEKMRKDRKVYSRFEAS